MELFDIPGLKGPPKATLVKRAKSYSDFYDAAIGYLGKEDTEDMTKDVFDVLENEKCQPPWKSGYEEYEDEILDASQEEYQYACFISLTMLN